VELLGKPFIVVLKVSEEFCDNEVIPIGTQNLNKN
jgi:hypothetical protein